MPERVLEMISPTLMEDKIAEIKIWLSGVSDRALLRYPTMVDPLKLLAMKLLTKLYECLFFSGESSKLYLVLSKMMQMTREHGMSPLSPLVFVLYSNYLGIIESNYEEGRRYVSLGLSLMKQYSCGAHDGQIMFHATHTKLFVEPLQSAQEHFLDSMKVSLKSGATRYAMKCALFYGACTLYTGSKKLKEVVKFMEDTLKQMRYHKNLLLYCNMLGLLRTTQRLIGESMLPQISDLRNAFGETLNEDDILQKVTATKDVMKHSCFAKWIKQETSLKSFSN
jgi:predicted ATPase